MVSGQGQELWPGWSPAPVLLCLGFPLPLQLWVITGGLEASEASSPSRIPRC